jgi:FtsP/CotA-like multicopper oxidase with cupredoxin domain
VSRTTGTPVRLALVTALLLFGVVQAAVAADTKTGGSTPVMTPEIQAKIDALARRMTVLPQQREAAAENRKRMQRVSGLVLGQGIFGAPKTAALSGLPGPGGQPDYFGFTPNWAFSPLIRKFVDTLPGLGAASANNLGNFIPVAKPDTITYPGSDYYEIELRQYTQKLHSDLPPTTLRGYVQVNYGTDTHGHNALAPEPIHYLGPFIQATKDRPVRIKFTNKLPTGAGGELFLPVDEPVMGAGVGPDGVTNYTQNRGTIHLHGGKTVWISDGTPHQWTTPAGESTPYPKGVSVKNVPDMPDPGDGSMTFFYSNEQSARLLWFHDHAYGITRLNVYAGEAAGYLLTDETEKSLIANKVIPADEIPLVIQDKTFVNAATIGTTDPTWNWGTTPPVARTGDLWFPHVYMPNQNPYDITGTNAMGRWDYGPWFFPPTPTAQYPPVPNPYYDPIDAPWEPPVMPAVPATSSVMEAFNDTPLVNGAAYPTVTLQPKSYRFRILNGANDRTFNLQLYKADPLTTSSDGRKMTEVKMVPAVPTAGFPANWPIDGRDGGVPDPATVGPNFIQIGNEGGFLPAPAVIPNQPVDWNLNMKTFTFGNVSTRALLLAPAERADVVVDFSKYAGQTLILYNDSPAAFPARDARNDYFTGAADQTDTGGTVGSAVGYGPNTRTIMQIKIAGTPAPAFNLATLQAAFASTSSKAGVFASSQDPILVAQAPYDSAYATSFPTIWPLWGYARIQDDSLTFKTIAGDTLSLDFEQKAIHDEMGGAYDIYGRMMGALGLEIPRAGAVTQQFIGQSYIDPTTEIISDSMTPMSPVAGDGTQIWKITQNGVDTHPIHFHLFNVQLLNRVGWDGMIEIPDANELGWKETVRVNPLQDTFVALRPTAPGLDWGVPESIRPLDPTQSLDATMGFTNVDITNGNALTVPQLNVIANFGWEYMWHCHILSHEEMAMMRPIAFEVAVSEPATPALAAAGIPGAPIDLTWIDATPAGAPATFGNPSNEIGFRIERATINAAGTVLVPYATIGNTLANVTTFQDTTTVAGTAYLYRVFAYNAAGEVPSLPVRVGPLGFFATNVISPWWTVGGTIVPSVPTSVSSGADSPAFAITPEANHHILDVWIDGVSVGATDSVTFKNVLADHALWAFFVPDTLPVTPTAGLHGAISPSSVQNVPYGTDITFNMTPDAHYHVDQVLVDGKSVGPVTSYTFTNVTTPHTISVTFAIDQFFISPTVTGPGTISPDTLQTVPYAGSATFTMAPTAGSRIANVLVDGVSVGAVSTYTFTNVSANHTIQAVFAPRIATSLTIRSSATSIRRRTKITLAGTLYGGVPAGTQVLLQYRPPGAGTYRGLWTGPVNSAGAWRTTAKPSARGTYRFQVVFAGDATFLPSASRVMLVVVR